MRHPGFRSPIQRSQVVRIGIAAWLAIFGSTTGRADRITLQGGTKLNGEILPDPKDPKKVLIFMEQGRNPLRQDRTRVLEVVDEPTILDQYLQKRKAAPETAEGRFDLGFWCEQAKLKDLARVHYEEALKVDPNFGLAHEKLGHIQRGGRWLVGDDIKKSQGLVKLKGHWITQTQKAQVDKEEALTKEQGDWVRRFKILADHLRNGTEDERREAEAKLLSTRDPAAIRGLQKVFDTDDADSRKLLARTLGGIDGPQAAIALVNGLVNEDEQDLRHTFVDELRRRREKEIESQLVKALRSSNTEYVNRAAWGIANLNLTTTSAQLIAALTTTRVDTVMPAVNNNNNLDPLTMVNGGNSVAPSALSAAPIAYNGSTVGYLLPPTVGPGVVAYGATSAPAYGLPPLLSDPLDPLGNPVGGAADLVGNIGQNNGANPNRGPMPQAVETTVPNPQVLAALVKFSGRDYGYDKDAWRGWLRTSKKAEGPAVRRVPQP